MIWYIPSWHGDYRLEPVTKTSCRLLVVNPTEAEKRTIVTFLTVARSRGWTTRKRLSTRATSSAILLACSVLDAGPILIAAGAAPEIGALTVLQFSDGEVRAEEDPELVAAIAKRAEEEPAKGKKPKAAATVKRPTSCCPSCIPGAIEPATEVLLTFLTPEQHRTWADERYVMVRGGLTGHRYAVAHRHSGNARRWSKICHDVTDGATLHFHDNSVPPEEEVLGTMLILQHRENWLRHEATCLGMFTNVFKNPFGGYLDGVQDATLTRRIGQLAEGLISRG